VDRFEPFGMPPQKGSDVVGQGSGSCDVDVILAARDFIIKGAARAVNKFEWQYTKLRHFQKELMIQIIQRAST